LLSSLAIPVGWAHAESGEVRRFEFHYAARIGPIPAGSGPVHVFVPLAASSDAQQVVDERITSDLEGSVETEPRYGNRYWRGSVAASDGGVIEVDVVTTVERRVSRREPPGGPSRALSAAEREALRKFLEANERVVVGHPVLDPILAEIGQSTQGAGAAARARATYDWVVDNVEYKKVGTGWGNGDTFWACSERYGNCTDFHALFISLARTQDIPARFEIGFPVPDERPEGEIGGYHCWVSFYLPETGWFPIDASEASKDPARREHFYGSSLADRIHLTTGRDLRLGEHHRGPALNYFVYPYVEVGGAPSQAPIERSFRYREAGDRSAALR